MEEESKNSSNFEKKISKSTELFKFKDLKIFENSIIRELESIEKSRILLQTTVSKFDTSLSKNSSSIKIFYSCLIDMLNESMEQQLQKVKNEKNEADSCLSLIVRETDKLFEEVDKIRTDIDTNFGNIILSMELGPFKHIMKEYTHELDRLSDQVENICHQAPHFEKTVNELKLEMPKGDLEVQVLQCFGRAFDLSQNPEIQNFKEEGQRESERDDCRKQERSRRSSGRVEVVKGIWNGEEGEEENGEEQEYLGMRVRRTISPTRKTTNPKTSTNNNYYGSRRSKGARGGSSSQTRNNSTGNLYPTGIYWDREKELAEEEFSHSYSNPNKNQPPKPPNHALNEESKKQKKMTSIKNYLTNKNKPVRKLANFFQDSTGYSSNIKAKGKKIKMNKTQPIRQTFKVRNKYSITDANSLKRVLDDRLDKSTEKKFEKIKENKNKQFYGVSTLKDKNSQRKRNKSVYSIVENKNKTKRPNSIHHSPTTKKAKNKKSNSSLNRDYLCCQFYKKMKEKVNMAGFQIKKRKVYGKSSRYAKEYKQYLSGDSIGYSQLSSKRRMEKTYAGK